MASAKAEAMKYLGNEDDYINLAGLNRERELNRQAYDTNMTSFQNAYNDLLNTIAGNRQKARLDFGSGRSTINENAFLRDRESAADLSSRGLRGGLTQLNKIGNRMETGRQYSNLANTFYNTMNQIDATERTGTNEYNTNVEQAKNTLEAALADIGAREAAGRNAYRAQVAQLAEQIQARRDAAAAAAAARSDARKAAQAQLTAEQQAKIKSIYAGKGSDEQKYKKSLEYLQLQGYNTGNATTLLSNWTGLTPVGAYGPQQPWVTPSTSSSNNSSLLRTLGALTSSTNQRALVNGLLNRFRG